MAKRVPTAFAVACLTAAAPSAETLFTPLPPARTGVDFVNPIDTEHPLDRLYIGAFACGGIAVGDLDGDGLHDLFLTSGPRPDRLYRNLGGMRFEDITGAAGLALSDPEDDRWSAGATLVDIDADGDLDIYVCRYDSPNQLWVNGGGAKFTERAAEFGLAIADASLSASFCDYDRDGDLDCFLLTRDFERAGGRPAEHPIEEVDGEYRITPPFDRYYALVPKPGGGLAYVNAGREDVLLQNNGGKFEDITAGSGLVGRDRGNSAIWWDYDGDGWPDLYVANDFKDPDRLYRNNRDGTFTDVIETVAPHTPWFSMGSDVADLDGDGRLDLLVADMAGTNHYRSKTTMGEIGAIRPFLTSAVPRQYMHNVLYLNNGSGQLCDAAYLAGLASSDWCWSVKLKDFDLDGRPDAYFTNGVARSFNNSDVQRAPGDYIGQEEWDFYEPMPPRRERDLAFANRGGLRFENVGAAWGLDHLGMSYAGAAGDLDGDGDLDLVTACLDEPVRIYQNHADTGWIKIELAGRGGNRGALGARVELRPDAAGATTQIGVLQPVAGFLSCDAPELVFAMPAGAATASATVIWPDGGVGEFAALAGRRTHTLAQPGEPAPAPVPPARPRPRFANIASPSLAALTHRETPYDDYGRQTLLPYQHSVLGPGMAWADVDADGDPDFYLAAAAGQGGRIARNEGGARFVPTGVETFAADAASEDLGVLFFDADRDGDPDLYAVSGGVECEPGSERLRDRLYLNDGSGTFAKAPEGALPDRRDSGSCVVAADYDRDGDLDLFVGGRVVPGAYPETPASALLRNDSTPGRPKFTDVTATAEGLRGAGLVTAALWSDADGDGWIDLLICCEWGPVKVFLNRGGSLEDASAESGIADRLGWWRSIAGADLDGDGDLDYLVGNQGLNTPYKATPEKPELLFYGDFDGSGRKQVIEAKFEGETCYPRRGLSCSSLAMPGLRERLGTFHQFASSSLADLYTETRLDTSLRLEANTLETCVLINDGGATFELRPLPRAAQMSTVQGVILTDLDADGHIDALLGQNFYGAQPEIGWLDAGLSTLLRGNGDGTFAEVGPTESGLAIRAGVTAATLVDLNRDARPEFAFATNNGPVYLFGEPGSADAPNRMLEVRVAGAPGNPHAVGARVTVEHRGRSQTKEITAGSGYLGQGEAALWFGLGQDSDEDDAQITVRWPDGDSVISTIPPNVRRTVARRAPGATGP